MKREDARSKFAEILSGEESVLELDRAALLIAAEDYPHLEVAHYLDKIDSLAEAAARSEIHHADPVTAIQRLSDLLFNELGFEGNLLDYFDARNSFLNEVIDRRLGIPITLSVLIIEVGRRLGLKISGVGLPGHFVVKYRDQFSEAFWDPFNGGRPLDEDGCRSLIDRMYNGSLEFKPSFLTPLPKKQILSRMLQNLKGIYVRAKDHHKTLGVIDRLLLINPGALTEIRDRGLVNFALKNYNTARIDLEQYLQLSPDAEDAAATRERIKQLRQRQAQFN